MRRCTAIFSVAEESGEPGLDEPQEKNGLCDDRSNCTAIFSVSEPVMLGRCMLLFTGVGICDFTLGLSRSLGKEHCASQPSRCSRCTAIFSLREKAVEF